MIAAFLIYSVVAGIVVVELLVLAVREIGLPRRLSQLNADLRAVRAAADDDTRQALLLRAGMRTLLLSLLAFITFAAACLVMALPLLWAQITAWQTTGYMASLTLVALAWWRIRRTRT